VARKILFYKAGPAEVLKIVEVPTQESGVGARRRSRSRNAPIYDVR